MRHAEEADKMSGTRENDALGEAINKDTLQRVHLIFSQTHFHANTPNNAANKIPVILFVGLWFIQRRCLQLRLYTVEWNDD